MSDYEYNKGKLKPSSMGDALVDFPDADFDDLEWSTRDRYTVTNGCVYKVELEFEGEYEIPELLSLAEDSDGVINFSTYHYNGTRDWKEVVEEGLNKDGAP